MHKGCTVVALIPARGGSKGIPQKNIHLLNNKPLIEYSIEAACISTVIDRVVVSSDDQAILNVGQNSGAEVLHRPQTLALDHTPTAFAIEHAISELALSRDSYIILLQPTSPLRSADDIDQAFASLGRNDALVSVSIPTHHPMKSYTVDDAGFLKGMWSDEAPYMPRQELPVAYMPNGAIYIFKVSQFLAERGIPTRNAIPFVMSATKSIDIDTIEDIYKVEAIIRSENER